MKRPAPIVFLLGNPVTVGVWSLATAVVVYRFVMELPGAELWGVVFFVLVELPLLKSSDNLRDYERAKREWESYNGRAAKAPKNRRALYDLALMAVIAFAYVDAQSKVGPPETDVAAVVFLFAVIALAARWIWRLAKMIRRRPPRERIETEKLRPVSISVRSQGSATADEAYRNLPDHCLALLNAPQRHR